MKILSAEDIRFVDAYTIEHEPVSAIDLMERAATALFKRVIKLFKPDEKIYICCGTGNNGGDGLALARLLSESGRDCLVLLVKHAPGLSKEASANLNRLREKFPARLIEISSADQLDETGMHAGVAVVDALLGTGLNKPVSGLLKDVILYLNRKTDRIVSIDIPSGLYADKDSSRNEAIIRSSLTLSFQLPKLAFMLPGNGEYVPEFEILDIGLLPQAIDLRRSAHYYVTASVVAGFLKKRSKFSHKGSYGHALLLAGSKGKSGAAVLAATACLRSGAGLLTLHSNPATLGALMCHLPEAMTSEDPSPDRITELNKPQDYSAIAVGPGIGLHAETQQVMKKLLQYYQGKLVIDADGLNILAENKTWLEFLPPATILTPHPREFERLTTKHADDFERLAALKDFSVRYNCIVILKGAHSVVAMPDGHLFFNSSGNAGLAKGGAGDALTGMLLGLLSRGYSAAQAALIGPFVHGYAADLLVKKKSMESILVSDLVAQLPKAFKKLEEKA